MNQLLAFWHALWQGVAIYLFALFLALIPNQTVLPKKTLVASPSAIINIPQPRENIATSTPIPWGTTEKVGDHLYRTYVGSDETIGTPEEILQALNVYRRDHGQGDLQKYEPLCPLAQSRAQIQDAAGNLDSHKGLTDYMADNNHWGSLGITAIGENSSYGYILSGTHLIEWVFDADAEHRNNQLNPNWSLVCTGVSGKTVDILFGKK